MVRVIYKITSQSLLWQNFINMSGFGRDMVEEPETDQVNRAVIEEEMKTAYLDYSMSVIVGRALPDARDGLKPVHRRILYAMDDMGIRWNSSHKKSARIVGEVLGKYHPHGDRAVYDALVRMAQDFSLRYTLVDGQGNFGSVDGDSQAAMRYTEARLDKISKEMLQDIKKDTVDFRNNFDNSLEEPEVLPSRIPNLLINGSTGIAVGMATNIPPHNLEEICEAVIKLVDNPDIDILELASDIRGPDFPTGGIINGREGILKAYKTGRGKAIVQSKVTEEEDRLIVEEIPYMVNKAKLVEKIARKVKDGVIEGISDLRDESGRMRIVIELKKKANPDVVKNKLFKNTRMQETFGMNMIALVDEQPKVLNLKEILEVYVDHRKDVIRRRTQYELGKAKDRAHILEGLLVALEDIDNVIDIIQDSESRDKAHDALREAYDLSEAQADAILDMRLSRLVKLESEKIESEYDELQEEIDRLENILENESEIHRIIKEDMREVIEDYGDERQTEVIDEASWQLGIEDLIKERDVVVTLSEEGYIKRMPLDEYRVQRRGGVGVIGADSKDDDFTDKVFVASTHDYLLVFTDQGQVYWKKTYKVPESGRYSRGRNIRNLIEIGQDENITSVIPVHEFVDDRYLMVSTKNGIVKKSSLDAYSNPRRGGIIAVNLDDDDEVVDVKLTDGEKDILVASKKGMAVRFDEADARPIGRTGRGVIGIRLEDGDEVVGMIVVRDDMDVLTLTKNGYGKRTRIDEYSRINRGGKGVINLNVTDKTGDVADVKGVFGDEDLMLLSKKGMIVRTEVESISRYGRNTQGVRVIKLKDGDELQSSAVFRKEDSEPDES